MPPPSSPWSIIFRPILYLLGLSSKPQMNFDPNLEIPPDDGTYLPVQIWKDNAVKSYLNFPKSREYWVVQVRRYKKRSATQHEYMVATVEHRGGTETWELQIERVRDNVHPDSGVPVLSPEQEANPADGVSSGQWAFGLEGQQPMDPVPPPKARGIDAVFSISGSLAKVGRASDIVMIWKAFNDTQIEALDLHPDPMRLVDLAILAYTVHENEVLYNLFKHQCFWYANMIVRVIAKKHNLPIRESSDREYCYEPASGKFYNIPVHVPRRKVVRALEKEFDKQLAPVLEQMNKRLQQESQERKDKEQAVKDKEQSVKDKEELEHLKKEVRRLRESELAQAGQSSTQK